MIYAIHGVVPERDRRLFCHRIMHDRRAFQQYLDTRAEKFQPLEDALEGRGDALTIDDATCAAKEAADLARAAGHAVTIFVNPYYIETGVQYFFNILNAALDLTRASSVTWETNAFPLGTYNERRRFRKAVQHQYRRTRSEQERADLVHHVAALLGAPVPELPEQARTLTCEQVKELQVKGVGIENHGWTHVDHSLLQSSECRNEMVRGREWIRGHGLGEGNVFAVPFGEPIPAHSVSDLCSHWLLLSSAMAAGLVTAAERVWNRTALPVNEQ